MDGRRGGWETLGRYTYRWEAGQFPLTADSLALGEFVIPRPGARVLDLGCGAGLLLLLYAQRASDAALFGVEWDEKAAKQAENNLLFNGLSGRIFTGDLGEIALPGGMDQVLANPPWHPAGQRGDRARVEDRPLARWCAAAAGTLRPKGRFALVHRPDRLVDLLEALRGSGLEPKRLRLVQHSRDKAPSAVLVEAVKGGRPGLEIEKTQVWKEEA